MASDYHQVLIRSLTILRTSFEDTMIFQNWVIPLLQQMYVVSTILNSSIEYHQEEVTIVGRITHDAESTATSKLSEGAICIESSRMLSSGARVPLILDSAIKIKSTVRGVGGVGIYPGAIVALKGKNGGGGYFLATEILGVNHPFSFNALHLST